MEYLHETEINTLLKVAFEHNREHHLALLLMYATGTRVSQALKMRGLDVHADPVTQEFSLRLPKAKRGHSRSYKIVKSADPIRDLTPLIALAKLRGTSKLFGGLTRHYLHVVIKRYARLAGLHDDSVHCHVLRHSTAMRIWEQTQRPGAITGYLCHSDTASVYPYLRENDAKLAEAAMATVLTNLHRPAH
jgi:site-specific recombinase XerD